MLILLGFTAMVIGLIEGSYFLDDLPYQIHTIGIMLMGALLVIAGVLDAKR